MVNGVSGYSNQEIMAQEAAKRRALLAQQNGYVQQTNIDEKSIMTNNSTAPGCTDGKDDGKIGFWQGLKSFGKGILNFAKGLVGFDEKGNFSAGRLLKNVAIGAGIAAVCVLSAGTALPAVIAGFGVAAATAGVVKSQYQFWTAKTDADAKAAMEGTGANVTALGLSLFGAKAAMKGVPGVDVSKYTGFKGMIRAGWDSNLVGIKKGWSAVKTGYNAYKAGGTQGLKYVAKKGWNENRNIVKTNWKNATKTATVQEKQANRVAEYKEQINSLKEQVAETTDKVAKNKLNMEINTLKKQQANIEKAFNEINGETKFAKAQSKLNELQKQIETMKHEAEGIEGARAKALAEGKIARLEQQLEVYKDVISQKTTQAKNIRAEIDRIEKIKLKDRTPEQTAKLTELKEQQNDLKFELPKRNTSEKLSKTTDESIKDVLEKREAYNKAKEEYAAAEKANKEFPAGDTSTEASAAQLKLKNAKRALDNAHSEYVNAKILNQANVATQSAASGADYVGAAIPKAGQFFKTFDNMYGQLNVPFVAGKRIPFTQLTIPSTIGTSHAIAATGKVGIPIVSDVAEAFGLNLKLGIDNYAVGGASIDEMLVKELQYEQQAQLQQQTAGQPTTADYAQAYQQALNEYQTLLQLQAQQSAQYQGMGNNIYQPQSFQPTGQLTPIDFQNIDYIMKAYGLIG